MKIFWNFLQNWKCWPQSVVIWYGMSHKLWLSFCHKYFFSMVILLHYCYFLTRLKKGLLQIWTGQRMDTLDLLMIIFLVSFLGFYKIINYQVIFFFDSRYIFLFFQFSLGRTVNPWTLSWPSASEILESPWRNPPHFTLMCQKKARCLKTKISHTTK